VEIRRKNGKIAQQFLPACLGALRGFTPVEGVAEKPEALERGGDFPPLILSRVIQFFCDVLVYENMKFFCFLRYKFVFYNNKDNI
jgi:hypothetical protein